MARKKVTYNLTVIIGVANQWVRLHQSRPHAFDLLMSRSSLETYTSEVSLATGSSSKAQFAMGHDSNPDDQQV